MVIAESNQPIVTARAARRDWFLLALTFICYAISTLYWVACNRAPLCWDPADHVRFACEYYQSLAALAPGKFLCSFFTDPFLSAFLSSAAHRFFLVSGPSLLAATIINLLLLAAMMAAIYDIGRRLYTREAGLLAAIIVPAYHINAALIHEFFLDFALMSWAAITLWLLLRTDLFRLRRESLLLGVALAAGMLCKQTFFLSCAPRRLCHLAGISAARARRAQ